MTVRPAAVAGRFYPGDPGELKALLQGYLAEATPAAEHPKAVIAPHAGFVYSGPIAASAFKGLAKRPDRISRVILVGPSHYLPFRGIAVPSADAFETPLGRVAVDPATADLARQFDQVVELDTAHEPEHALETHLPFLQEILGTDTFQVVPLVLGEVSPADVADVLEALWGGPETLLSISSDLSHYFDYATAQRMDQATSDAVEALNPDAIEPEHACGQRAIQGLLRAASRQGVRAATLDLRNSGDTAGPRDRVVGYGAYAFHG